MEQEALLDKLEANRCLKDLYKFNFDVLGMEPVGSYSKTLKELCRFIDKDKGKKKLILIPRGHLKSTIVTIGRSLQAIAENPDVRILIISATYTMACTFLNQIKKTLQNNPKFKRYYGALADNPSRWSENQIDIKKYEKGAQSKEPTITVMGVDGNLVSQHYDIIIMDDVVNRDNINTKERIEKVILSYKDMLDLLEPGGELICIGTRWHYDDLYGRILGTEDGEAEIGHDFEVFLRQVAEGGDIERGKILWPEKFTKDVLRNLLKSKGPYEFNAQYNNNPVDDESATFKRSWFKYFDTDMLKGRNLYTVMAIDPAISQEKEADYTAMVVLSKDQFGYEYVRDMTRRRLTPKELIEEMFRLDEKWHPKQVAIETVAFQKALQYYIYEEMRNRGINLPIVEVKPDARESKEMRIRRLQPKYASGMIWHDKGHFNTQYLEDELLRFPKAPHDDLIDALAYAEGLVLKPTSNIQKRKSHYLY
jgi:predicted phage terminase large subunit-like protein